MTEARRRRIAALPLLLAAASCVLALTASTTALGRPGPLTHLGSGDRQQLLRIEHGALRQDELVALDGMLVESPKIRPARPFRILASNGPQRSLDCLTAAVYHEARSEGEAGQRAVAQVVLNRVRHPTFPNSICGVVYQGAQRRTGCQFTFTCDGSLRRRRVATDWERARKIAEEALAGRVFAAVGHATHYHTNQVRPYWASTLTRITSVGTHVFYRWRGAPGEPPAFSRIPAPEREAATALVRAPDRPRPKLRPEIKVAMLEHPPAVAEMAAPQPPPPQAPPPAAGFALSESGHLIGPLH
ncbi:MAG TPA: cell wall hydrolase [Allosphingosinicella sp.]|nr:cell wall hydrolase [Allosphingosinicella sp.]